MTARQMHTPTGLLLMASLAVLLGAQIATVASEPDRGSAQKRDASAHVVASILVYHRFGPTVTDTMTVRTSTFRSQLQFLKEQGYHTASLRMVVDYLRGAGPAPGPHAVVITADDGHQSVFSDMLPMVREYGVPVTLFIYPSAISNASYAMSWHQLAALKSTGLFDIQSHSYWHPNFRNEKRRLSAQDYDEFVTNQLVRSRTLLATRLGTPVDLIAWPFGLYDDDLMGRAALCGYVAGLTLERRMVTLDSAVMALPRFLVTDAAGAGRSFAAMLPE